MPRSITIPSVLDARMPRDYAREMSEKDLRWLGWGKRLRAHAKAKKIKRQTIADRMDVSYPQVGHWYNGTREREIQLEHFIELCAAHDADPSTILFRGPAVPDEAPLEVKQAVEILVSKVKVITPELAQQSPRRKPQKRDKPAK